MIFQLQSELNEDNSNLTKIIIILSEAIFFSSYSGHFSKWIDFLFPKFDQISSVICGANGAKIFTSIYSNPTTGIGENIITKNAKVFPNPFTDKIIIDFTYESNNETKSIKLFSITGELTSQISITNNPSTQLELNNLSSGVYMLVITSGSEIQTIKLVKE